MAVKIALICVCFLCELLILKILCPYQGKHISPFLQGKIGQLCMVKVGGLIS